MLRVPSCQQVALVFAILLVVAPRPGEAQAPATVLADLPQRVDPGATLIVTDQTGQKHSGRLVAIGPTQLVLAADGGERAVPAESIVEIRRRERDSLQNGGIIGGLIGAAPMVFVLASDWCSDEGPGCEGDMVRTGLLYVAAGVGAGLAIDALVAKHTVLYRRPGLEVKLSLVPGRGGLGPAVSFRF